MTIWDNLANGAYENKNPYPVKPRRPPILGAAASPAEHREYADKLEAYERELVQFRLDKDAWHTCDGEFHEQFQKDLEAHYEMTGHPKAQLLYGKAYERGHSGGWHEIACVYSDLVELLK